MKIVIDARFLGIETGIGRYIKEVVENLEKIDSDNHYIIFLRKENWNIYFPKKQNFIKRQVDIKWYSLREQFFLPGYIKKEKPDLCFFPHFNVPIFSKIPFVVTVHDLILRHFPSRRASTLGPLKFYLKYFFYNLILRITIFRAKKITVPTYFVRNDIIKEFKTDPDKIRVIYEGVSSFPQTAPLTERYLKEKGIVLPYILYVGNAYPHKNLKRLIEVFKEIKKERKDLQLVLVGKRDFFSKQLEEEIEKNNQFKTCYPKDVIFYGYADDRELSLLYEKARLYVFPTFMEGFGLPPLEALFFGVRVVCSDIPALREVLGSSVSYFNPRDIMDMKNKIGQELNRVDSGQKEEINIKLLSRYSWTKTAEQILEILKIAGGANDNKYFDKR